MTSVLRHLLVYVVIVTVLFSLAWSFLTGENVIDRVRFYRFDPLVWKNAEAEQRYYMARYMVDQKILLEKTKAQVFEMLGGDIGGARTSYYLGPEHDSMFRIDSDWLSIEFSTDKMEAVVKHAMIHSG